jgi:hypothetical protein
MYCTHTHTHTHQYECTFMHKFNAHTHTHTHTHKTHAQHTIQEYPRTTNYHVVLGNAFSNVIYIATLHTQSYMALMSEKSLLLYVCVCACVRVCTFEKVSYYRQRICIHFENPHTFTAQNKMRIFPCAKTSALYILNSKRALTVLLSGCFAFFRHHFFVHCDIRPLFARVQASGRERGGNPHKALRGGCRYVFIHKRMYLFVRVCVRAGLWMYVCMCVCSTESALSSRAWVFT